MLSLLFATATTDNAAQQPGGGYTFLIMLVALFAVMYFMVIRPENKKKKEQEALRAFQPRTATLTELLRRAKENLLCVEHDGSRAEFRDPPCALRCGETDVNGNPRAMVVHLHQVAGQSQVNGLANQVVGHGVLVPAIADQIIIAHLGMRPG